MLLPNVKSTVPGWLVKAQLTVYKPDVGSSIALGKSAMIALKRAVGRRLRVPPLSRKTGVEDAGYVFGASPGLVMPTADIEIQYLSKSSGDSAAGIMGHFSREPVYFIVSIPPKMIAPSGESTLLRSRLNALLCVTPCKASSSMTVL